MTSDKDVGCGTKARATSLATCCREAIGGSREEHATCSLSVPQTFMVPACPFSLPGLPPAEGIVKKADTTSGAPADSTLPGMLPVEKMVKEPGPRPEGPTKRVKLDVKRSYWKGAAEPRSCCRDPRRAEPECRRRLGSVYTVKLDGKGSRQNSSILDGGDGPRPNTARPEGGCLTIRHHYQCPLLFWLKCDPCWITDET